MVWKLWSRTKVSPQQSSAPVVEWSSDACDSIRLLFGMYVSNTRPFSEWRDAGTAVPAGIDQLADTNAKAYQLWLWFALYRERRGRLEATMLRDAFINHFELAAPGGGLAQQVRWLLGFQDKALEYFHDLPDDKKAAASAAMGLDLPAEYFFAMYQLLAFPESPYLEGKRDLPPAEHNALCISLVNAKQRAIAMFEPMVGAIRTFDASRIPHWEWSPQVGAHERHLQRRHNNPLFAPDRQNVTAADVFAARVRDARAYDDAIDELESLRSTLREDLPPEWLAHLNVQRERIEALQDRIADMGALGRPLRNQANKLRAFVVGVIRDTLATTKSSRILLIDEAETLRAQREAIFASDWSRHIRHPEGIIPAAEVVASLLSEDLESLGAIVESMERDAATRELLSHARSSALNLVCAVKSAGSEIPGIEEKLRVLGVSL